MAAYNSRNNGSTAHLFGTTPKLPKLSRMSEPQPQERIMAQRARAQETAAPVMAPTFAQMQEQGQARPAQPTSAPSQAGPTGYNLGRQGRRLAAAQGFTANAPQPTGRTAQPRNDTLDSISQILAGGGGSRYDENVYRQLRDAMLAEMDADFAAQQQRLDEEMARRGIYSSSIAAGRMGDLAGQQARARSSMEADLLARAADAQMQDRIARDQMFMSIAQILSQMDPAKRADFLRQIGGAR